MRSTNSKVQGLAYAPDGEGRELPVIDVSHSSFALSPSEAEIEARTEAAIRSVREFALPSSSARRAEFAARSANSVLASAIAGGSGGFVGGMAMYLLKLGPDNLDPDWAGPLDREIADSLPCYSARLRLRDTATLLAEACRASLEAAEPGAPLHLANVASGAAMDSLNALIILSRQAPALLEGRAVVVHALDLDGSCPAFAGRALEALREEGGPLRGLDARLEWESYDWSVPGALRDLARRVGEEDGVLALSSEGGLFEYAADEDIAANLRAAREGLSEGRGERAAPAWVGTLSRVEGKAAFLNGASGAKLRLRPLAALEAVAQSAGYRLTRSIACPLSTSFVLVAAARPAGRRARAPSGRRRPA